MIPAISTNINAQSKNYKELYIEDNNAYSFSSQLGIIGNLTLQSDVINTDVSLLPFKSIETEYVTSISRQIVASPYIKTSSLPMAEVTFRKSSQKVTYSRNFNKVDTYLSYVGGLVGTIIGLIFIMGPYTEKSYEISFAKKVMSDNAKEEIPSQSFNILYFFLMYVKQLLAFCNCDPDWPRVRSILTQVMRQRPA